MAKERFYVVATDETEYYGDAEFNPIDDCVAAVFCLYLVREGERTHIASTQANSAAINLGTEVIFTANRCGAAITDGDLFAGTIGTAEDAEAEYERREEIREEIEEGNRDDQYQMDYYGYMDFKTMDRRRYGRPLIVNLDGREYKGGLTGDAYHKAIWDAALEEASTNVCAYYPPILQREGVFEEYQRDMRIKKGNERPLQAYRSGQQLPLFAHAAQAAGMVYEDVTRLHWY